MAEDSFPSGARVGDAGTGALTDVEYEELVVSAAYPTGIVGAASSAAYPVYADGTGTRAIHFRAGSRGMVRGFLYKGGATDTTISAAANATGSDRYDLAIWRLDRAVDSTVRAAVLTGTTNPDGPAPTFSDVDDPDGVYEYPIGVFKIPNGAATIDAAKLTFKPGYWIRPPSYMTLSGATFGAPSPIRGRLVHEYDTNKLKYGDGSKLVTYAEDTNEAGLTTVSGWDIRTPSSVAKVNGLCTLCLQVNRIGGSVAAQTDAIIGKLPDAKFWPRRAVRIMAYHEGLIVYGLVNTNGDITINQYTTAVGTDDGLSFGDVAWRATNNG